MLASNLVRMLLTSLHLLSFLLKVFFIILVYITPLVLYWIYMHRAYKFNIARVGVIYVMMKSHICTCALIIVHVTCLFVVRWLIRRMFHRPRNVNYRCPWRTTLKMCQIRNELSKAKMPKNTTLSARWAKKNFIDLFREYNVRNWLWVWKWLLTCAQVLVHGLTWDTGWWFCFCQIMLMVFVSIILCLYNLFVINLITYVVENHQFRTSVLFKFKYTFKCFNHNCACIKGIYMH